jgi:hypothetical protein
MGVLLFGLPQDFSNRRAGRTAPRRARGIRRLARKRELVHDRAFRQVRAAQPPPRRACRAITGL